MDLVQTSSFCFLSALRKELQEKLTAVKLLIAIITYCILAQVHIYIYRHIYLHIAAALTVPDIYENVYL